MVNDNLAYRAVIGCTKCKDEIGPEEVGSLRMMTRTAMKPAEIWQLLSCPSDSFKHI